MIAWAALIVSAWPKPSSSRPVSSNRRHSASATCPVFRQLRSPGVGAELLPASIDQGPRIERLSTESGRVACPTAKGEQVTARSGIRTLCSDRSRGTTPGLAATCLIAQVIANEFAEFILQEAVNRARRRHRARLAIYKLISAPVLRIRFEELSTVIRTGIFAGTMMWCLYHGSSLRIPLAADQRVRATVRAGHRGSTECLLTSFRMSTLLSSLDCGRSPPRTARS